MYIEISFKKDNKEYKLYLIHFSGYALSDLFIDGKYIRGNVNPMQRVNGWGKIVGKAINDAKKKIGRELNWVNYPGDVLPEYFIKQNT